MKQEQVHELLYQAMETEQGGVAVSSTAVKCARSARSEMTKTGST